MESDNLCFQWEIYLHATKTLGAGQAGVFSKAGSVWHTAISLALRSAQGRRLNFQSLEDRRLLAVVNFTSTEDDGSIPLANNTNLQSGDTGSATAYIGNGPYGLTSGDFDFYKVYVRSGQNVTASIDAARMGSPLDSILIFYDSNGNELDFDDNSFFNGQLSTDSQLNETPSVGGYYYFAVGQNLIGSTNVIPSNPFQSDSGPGVNVAQEGAYTITITLGTYTNIPPIAVNDSATVNQGSSVAIDVLSNDSSPDGLLDDTSVRVQTQPKDGTFSVNLTTGVITYTPNQKFFGTDTFTYNVKDLDGLVSNTATVTVTVAQVITSPVAGNSSFFIGEDTPKVLNVLANVTDQNGTVDPTTVAITTPAAHGTATVNPMTGAVTYTPNSGYLGLDTFKFQVADDSGAISNIATVTLRVVPAPPTAVNDTATTPEDSPVTIDELANDTAIGATLVPSSVAIVGGPTNGTASINTTNGKITYTPANGFVGTDTISYTVMDTNGSLSNVATITITVTFVDFPPVAGNDTAQTNPGVPVNINVLANDTDPNNDIAPNTVTVTSGPSNGTATVNTTTGVVTYAPNPGFAGDDTFTYTVASTHGAVSNPATVTIHVNLPPVANDDSATTLEETPVAIDVLANDTDPQGTIVPSTVTVTTAPANGTTSVDPTTGQVTYTPAFNFFGTDTFQYTVSDSNGVTSNPATVTITVTFVPKPPVAANDYAGTAVNTPITVNVLANDADFDSTLVPSTLAIVGAPIHGTAVANSDGTITYTPAPGFTGADLLTYTVQDALGLTSNVGTLYLRAGAPVSFAGFVYVDTNDNGVFDTGETPLSGVTITLTKTDGPVTFSLTTTTAADGSYSFTEVPGKNIMPAGTYTLTETSPIYFADGKDTPGNLPATVTQDMFSGINIAAGQAATGFNFGELGLLPQYVAAYASRRAFFASSTPTVMNLNLSQGPVFFALSGATQGTFTATAASSGAGTVQLMLFGANQNVLSTTTAAAGQTQAALNWNSSQGPALLLEVTGTDPAVSVATDLQVPTSSTIATPIVSWHDSSNALDVNGDGKVTPLDALLVINALNSQGAGSLGPAPLDTHDYLDVANNGVLSPLDALLIINELNGQGGASIAPATIDTGLAASPADETDLDQVAFTVASTTVNYSSTPVSTAPVQTLVGSPTVVSPAAPSAANGMSAASSLASTTASSSVVSRRQQATDAAITGWQDDLLS